jgi:hypothetical protein
MRGSIASTARAWIQRMLRPEAPHDPVPSEVADPRRSDGSMWALVGNVVAQHILRASGEVLRGSRHFTPGTKVYCLPAQWGDGYETCVAVGIARRPRRWITVVMHTGLITNWRAEVIYHPQVTKRLREGFDGFNRQWLSREEVEESAHWLNDRAERPPTVADRQ